MIIKEDIKVLHIMHIQKFLPPYIKFVSENFNPNNHKFVFVKTPEKKDAYGWKDEYPVQWIETKLDFLGLIKSMYKADRIILHSLWLREIVTILCLQPWLLKKCYWVMWGGDFYFPEKQSLIKKQVIKRMGNFITYIKGDYELAQKWYGAKGKYHECFMYPSNLYKEYSIQQKEHRIINIQLGNSADPTNHHINVLKKLTRYKDENIKIFVPLSYGDEEYAKEVIQYGKEIFSDKFIPLTEFMPFEKYLEFLSKIDIAIFAHKRQQAMGNTITLLGLGKKVFLDSQTVQFEFFKQHNVSVYDVNSIDLNRLSHKITRDNQEKIKYLFSKETLLQGLQRIFND